MNNFHQKTYLRKSRNLAALILFLCAFLGVREASAQALTVKQGEVMIYSIKSKADVQALFGGVQIPVFTHGGQNYALVAADVSKKPGNYYLRIRSGDKELEKKVIKVNPGTYPQVVRGVAYKFGTLSKEKQEAVTKDKAPLLDRLSKASNAALSKISRANFRNPLDSTITVTSPYGYKRIYTNHSTIHHGVDFRAKIGTPVYAISDGQVLWGEGKALYLEGPTVVLDHGGGVISKYLHLSKVVAQTGALVKAGDLIGYSGDQGADVSGAHLHFAIKVGNASVSPLQFVEEFKKLKIKSL